MSLETQDKKIVVAFTGHRKIDGPPGEVRHFLLSKLANDRRIWKTISGGALGWDQVALTASKQAGLYHLLAEPFLGFWEKWPPHIVEEYMELKYRELHEDDDEVVQVSDPGYENWKYHARNEYMVNRADEVWAWWDGTRKGGTYACLKYAHKKGIPIVNIYKEFHNIS